MKKVLFVDEKQYRFSFYYEPEKWWIINGIKPYFKAYEKRKDKWFIYLWLILNRPHSVVFVQLSLKNLILARMSNILGVKTVFWQHGVFGYDKQIIDKYSKIKASLNYLLCFSEYDANKISLYFRYVKNLQLIHHYETAKIRASEKIDKSILYIGQILTKEQIKGSSAKFPYDEQCETILNNLWEYLSKQDYNVFLKKHPGDKSEYLEHLCVIYPNFFMIKKHIIPTIVIGHYSTLVIPYLQMGIPFLQIHHEMNKFIDFSNYSPNQKQIIKYNENSIDNIFQQKRNDVLNENKKNSPSISEIIKSLV